MRLWLEPADGAIGRREHGSDHLVDLGVDLSMMRTVGDLQGGLEEAERLLGHRPAEAEDVAREPVGG